VTHAAPPPADKVALLGPRAVGKSTLGRALAARLGWRFVDTDDEVGTRVGCPAGAFLAARGEAAFRAVEAEVAVAALAPGPRAVVALGGGAVTLAAVRAALRRPGVVAVELRAPIEVLVERQARDPRPKLTDLPLADEVAALVRARAAAHAEVAAFVLETFPANVDACCARLLATIGPLPSDS